MIEGGLYRDRENFIHHTVLFLNMKEKKKNNNQFLVYLPSTIQLFCKKLQTIFFFSSPFTIFREFKRVRKREGSDLKIIASPKKLKVP